MTFNTTDNVTVNETGLVGFKCLELRINKKTNLPEFHSRSGSKIHSLWPYREEKVAVCVFEDKEETKVKPKPQGGIYVDPPVDMGEEFEQRTPHNRKDHLCGIHVAKGVAHAMEYFNNEAKEQEEYATFGTALAEVSMWGKVLEGPNGFRAEKAYITCVYIPIVALEHIGAQIVDAYGCTIKTEDDDEQTMALLRGRAMSIHSLTDEEKTELRKIAPHVANILESGEKVVVNPVSLVGFETLKKVAKIGANRK